MKNLTRNNKSNKKIDSWLYEISNSITEPKKLLEFLKIKKYPKYYNTELKKNFHFEYLILLL